MDKLLDNNIVKQITEAFAQLKEPVQLLFFGSQDGCEYCPEARQLLEEVAATSPKISLSVHDIQADKALADQYNVDKVPVIVVAAQDGEKITDLGIQFSGVPSGHEFATLINDIMIVSSRDSGLTPAVREFLRNLNQPLLLQVFVTPT
jgi:alkyl hydroperoxide reductase subunit AhpF